jgi:hypothetical protein
VNWRIYTESVNCYKINQLAIPERKKTPRR